MTSSVRAPYDQLLMWKGKAAPIDAKTFDGLTLCHSDLVPHQIEALVYAWKFGLPAGYLVWHRPVDKVVFYGALMLADLNPKTSLNWEDGLCIGGVEDMDPRKIFQAAPIP